MNDSTTLPIFHTERLCLRGLTPADEDTLVALDADPEVMRYLTLGVPSTRDDIQRGISRMLAVATRTKGLLGLWMAHDRDTDAFVGTVFIRPARETPDDLSRLELGYRLPRASWGRGLATEGSLALMRYGFDTLCAAEIFACTMEANHRSRRVMEKCGLAYVRSFYDERFPGTTERDVEYRMTHAMWQARASRMDR